MRTISELSEALRTRKVSSTELVQEALGRIAAAQPALNAFITVMADDARDQAKAAEAEIKAGRWKGPLHGVPVAVKTFMTRLA